MLFECVRKCCNLTLRFSDGDDLLFCSPAVSKRWCLVLAVTLNGWLKPPAFRGLRGLVLRVVHVPCSVELSSFVFVAVECNVLFFDAF